MPNHKLLRFSNQKDVVSESIREIDEEIKASLELLRPIYVEGYDPSFCIYSEKYLLEDRMPLGQRVLADFLKPIPPGEHKKQLKIYTLHTVQMVSETECEVSFLFKWE